MLKDAKQLDVCALKITGTQPVSEFAKEGTTYKSGSLQVRGGVYIEKGLKIGNQEQVCNGMLFYDGENFFGHSEKLGTCLLSNHSISSELTLPTSIFENMPENKKKYTIVAAQNNLTKESTQSEEGDGGDEGNVLVKHIIVDILMKDISNFYIIIPQIYQNTNFHLQLHVSFQFDEQSYIHSAYVHILNQTNKELSLCIDNDSRYVYYEDGFQRKIDPKSVGLYTFKRITPQFFLLSSSFFKKDV